MTSRATLVPISAKLAAGVGCLLMLTAVASGCSGTRFQGNVYRGDGFSFSLSPPSRAWQRLEHSQAALAFHNASAGASMLVNGRCGLDGEDIPLTALTQHLFMQFTERTITLQETVPFADREALHTQLEAKLDGVPMRYDAYVLKKDGCVYDLLYFASADGFEQGHADFRGFVHSFATIDEAADG